MQKDLDAAGTPIPVHIVGVNQATHEASYNDAGGICDGRDLPFLEEGVADGVWETWKVRYRDVLILDTHNELVGSYNLSDHDLSNPAHYQELQTLLTQAASAAP